MRVLRRAWRRLTSMRTALVLLFLLAVAAVPGSLLPQRPLNPDKVTSYISDHGWWGRFLDRIGMFDVFGSVWFAAIYLLLFVSLVGCLVPRIRLHARAMLRKPLPAPRNLNRLPESGRFETATPPAEYASAARAELGRRWRVEQRVEDSGAITLSAEKGYSRETGNLIFHVALLASLVLIAVGRLYAYEGSVIVRQGTGFCNNVGQWDSQRLGRFAAEGKVHPAPFCVDRLTKFTARYTPEGEATDFAADIAYRPTLHSAERHTTITVNYPLRLEGDRIYLINHGFAPRVTIRMPDGSVRHDVQNFVPTNGATLFSEGAFQETGRPGEKEDVGIAGYFAPTPVDQGKGVFASASPAVNDPVLGIFVYTGEVNANGAPHSVYSLDLSHLHKIGRANLRIGETKQFPNGVSVRFDGWVPWATLQVSHDPAQGYLLISALAMVLGLLGSLAVRRRRLWLRIASPARDGADGSPTVVQVGGLARSDSGNFTNEFAGLLERLAGAGTAAHSADQSTLHISRDADSVGAGKE